MLIAVFDNAGNKGAFRLRFEKGLNDFIDLRSQRIGQSREAQ
jgi:ribosomal protein L35AE/L33A